MSLSILLLLMLILYLPLALAFYFFYDKNKKVAKGFLIAAILSIIATIFLAVFLMFTYHSFYIIIVLLQGSTLSLNIRTFRKAFNIRG